MIPFDEMRVTDFPSLGEPVFGGLQAPIEPEPVPVPQKRPPLQMDTSRLEVRLDAILDELMAVRQDLESRTLWARLARFWTWVKGLWV